MTGQGMLQVTGNTACRPKFDWLRTALEGARTLGAQNQYANSSKQSGAKVRPL
jgi:hypothetical protein